MELLEGSIGMSAPTSIHPMHLPHAFLSPVIRLARLSPQLAMLVSLFVALPAACAASKDKNPSISIYCMAYADGLKSVFVKTSAERYESVSLSTANIVEAADALVEDGRILLYGPAGEDGKHPVVADAEITGIQQPMIVVHPAGKDAGLAYDSKAVEADPKQFPLGSFNLVNFSPNPVRIVHEEVMIELESAGGRIFTPDQAAGESLAVRMDYKAGENWTLLSSARWPVRNDRRTLVCFQLDPVSKRMNIKSIPLRENPSR
ncbi:MAG: hypothetical protein RLZZ245_626 [Verrucomicrobiota bacterium]